MATPRLTLLCVAAASFSTSSAAAAVDEVGGTFSPASRGSIQRVREDTVGALPRWGSLSPESLSSSAALGLSALALQASVAGLASEATIRSNGEQPPASLSAQPVWQPSHTAEGEPMASRMLEEKDALTAAAQVRPGGIAPAAGAAESGGSDGTASVTSSAPMLAFTTPTLAAAPTSDSPPATVSSTAVGISAGTGEPSMETVTADKVLLDPTASASSLTSVPSVIPTSSTAAAAVESSTQQGAPSAASSGPVVVAALEAVVAAAMESADGVASAGGETVTSLAVQVGENDTPGGTTSTSRVIAAVANEVTAGGVSSPSSITPAVVVAPVVVPPLDASNVPLVSASSKGRDAAAAAPPDGAIVPAASSSQTAVSLLATASSQPTLAARASAIAPTQNVSPATPNAEDAGSPDESAPTASAAVTALVVGNASGDAPLERATISAVTEVGMGAQPAFGNSSGLTEATTGASPALTAAPQASLLLPASAVGGDELSSSAAFSPASVYPVSVEPASAIKPAAVGGTSAAIPEGQLGTMGNAATTPSTGAPSDTIPSLTVTVASTDRRAQVATESSVLVANSLATVVDSDTDTRGGAPGSLTSDLQLDGTSATSTPSRFTADQASPIRSGAPTPEDPHGAAGGPAVNYMIAATNASVAGVATSAMAPATTAVAHALAPSTLARADVPRIEDVTRTSSDLAARGSQPNPKPVALTTSFTASAASASSSGASTIGLIDAGSANSTSISSLAAVATLDAAPMTPSTSTTVSTESALAKAASASVTASSSVISAASAQQAMASTPIPSIPVARAVAIVEDGASTASTATPVATSDATTAAASISVSSGVASAAENAAAPAATSDVTGRVPTPTAAASTSGSSAVASAVESANVASSSRSVPTAVAVADNVTASVPAAGAIASGTASLAMPPTTGAAAAASAVSISDEPGALTIQLNTIANSAESMHTPVGNVASLRHSHVTNGSALAGIPDSRPPLGENVSSALAPTVALEPVLVPVPTADAYIPTAGSSDSVSKGQTPLAPMPLADASGAPSIAIAATTGNSEHALARDRAALASTPLPGSMGEKVVGDQPEPSASTSADDVAMSASAVAAADVAATQPTPKTDTNSVTTKLASTRTFAEAGLQPAAAATSATSTFLSGASAYLTPPPPPAVTSTTPTSADVIQSAGTPTKISSVSRDPVPAHQLPNSLPKTSSMSTSASAFSVLAASRNLFVMAIVLALAVYFRRPLLVCIGHVRRLPRNLATLRGRLGAPPEEVESLVRPLKSTSGSCRAPRNGLSGAVRARTADGPSVSVAMSWEEDDAGWGDVGGATAPMRNDHGGDWGSREGTGSLGATDGWDDDELDLEAARSNATLPASNVSVVGLSTREAAAAIVWHDNQAPSTPTTAAVPAMRAAARSPGGNAALVAAPASGDGWGHEADGWGDDEDFDGFDESLEQPVLPSASSAAPPPIPPRTPLFAASSCANSSHNCGVGVGAAAISALGEAHTDGGWGEADGWGNDSDDDVLGNIPASTTGGRLAG